MSEWLRPCRNGGPDLVSHTTSPVGLEVANHGLSLTTQLEGQLVSYAKRQAVIDAMRRQEIDRTRAETRNDLLQQRQDEQLYAFSGQARYVTVIQQLRSRVALLRTAAMDPVADAAQVADQAGQTIPPQPALNKALGATGKAFGALGQELSFAERAALAASFFKEVQDEAKKNQEAADGIQAASAKRPPDTAATLPSTLN